MLKYFLTFTEIRTKIVSTLPYFFTLLFYLWKFDKPLNIKIAIIYFIAMFLFDLITTALNTYAAQNKEKNLAYLDVVIKQEMDKNNINNKTNLYIIIGMFVIALPLCAYLVYLCGIYVFLLGATSVSIGYLYSNGPLPIYKTPLGEVFSGVTMGFVVPLIFLFTQSIDPHMTWTFNSIFDFNLDINIGFYLNLLFVYLPFICVVSNIMLANNISDLDNDKSNERYTFPVVFGKDKGILLFKICSFASIFFIIFNAIIGVYPISFILSVLIIPVIYKNTHKFCANPSKSQTFQCAINNFLVTVVSSILFMLIGLFI